jgi:hypothetical protein
VSGEWCVVLDAASSRAARKLGDALGGEGLDVEIDAKQARVWCFAYEQSLDSLVASVREILRNRGLSDTLQIEPRVRVWNETHRRYVDPASPDEDPDGRRLWVASDLEPGEIRWLVRLELETAFELRRVRPRLALLGRPVAGTGRRHVDLGVRDATDAEHVAGTARTFPGVSAARPRELDGRLRRWLIRQRLARDRAEGSDGPGYDYPDLGA